MLVGTLNSVAQRVVESTSAVAASLSTVNEDGSLALGGQFGLPEGFFEAVEEGIRAGAPTPNREALKNHEPVVIHNVRDYIQNQPEYAPLRKFSDSVAWDIPNLDALFEDDHMIVD